MGLGVHPFYPPRVADVPMMSCFQSCSMKASMDVAKEAEKIAKTGAGDKEKGKKAFKECWKACKPFTETAAEAGIPVEALWGNEGGLPLAGGGGFGLKGRHTSPGWDPFLGPTATPMVSGGAVFWGGNTPGLHGGAATLSLNQGIHPTSGQMMGDTGLSSQNFAPNAPAYQNPMVAPGAAYAASPGAASAYVYQGGPQGGPGPSFPGAGYGAPPAHVQGGAAVNGGVFATPPGPAGTVQPVQSVPGAIPGLPPALTLCLIELPSGHPTLRSTPPIPRGHRGLRTARFLGRGTLVHTTRKKETKASSSKVGSSKIGSSKTNGKAGSKAGSSTTDNSKASKDSKQQDLKYLLHPMTREGKKARSKLLKDSSRLRFTSCGGVPVVTGGGGPGGPGDIPGAAAGGIVPFPNPAPSVQGIAGSGADGLLGADPGAAHLGVQVADSALAACMQQCAVQAGAEASKKAADGSGGDVAQQHAKKCLAACLPYANVYRGGNAALGWHSGMPVPLYGDDAAKKAGDFAKEEKPRPILANAAYAAHAVCVTNCVKAAKKSDKVKTLAACLPTCRQYAAEASVHAPLGKMAWGGVPTPANRAVHDWKETPGAQLPPVPPQFSGAGGLAAPGLGFPNAPSRAGIHAAVLAPVGSEQAELMAGYVVGNMACVFVCVCVCVLRALVCL